MIHQTPTPILHNRTDGQDSTSNQSPTHDHALVDAHVDLLIATAAIMNGTVRPFYSVFAQGHIDTLPRVRDLTENGTSSLPGYSIFVLEVYS